MEDYEEFSEKQLKILEQYVTSSTSNVFALRNLPEVIKGALFSRYSRSALPLRTLLLKEFILNEDETAFGAMAPSSVDENAEEQLLALKKAQSFYDRILDGYGDDSIGELGGAHLAIENISMLAAKIIEDCRIGGSPLEKSTRYIYFDQKVNGEYLFYREPILMTSAYRNIYIETCNMLFETYSRLIPTMTSWMESQFPKDDGVPKGAYAATIRAKVLDCLRGLLPTGTLTNMGLYGNGRFFEQLIHKLNNNTLAELQEIGKKTYTELNKVIPSFIRRASSDHHTHTQVAELIERRDTVRRETEQTFTDFPERSLQPGVKLLDWDREAPQKVAAALLFEYSNKGLGDLLSHVKELSVDEVGQILDSGASFRENRRQKSPRALEHATFTFEIIANFGVYRDLQRHRILTQERQLLTCDYDYFMPPELKGLEIESDYCEAMHRAKEVFDIIAAELPEEAQYVVPMAFNIRWYFHVNLRSLQWLCELRSAPAGHPNYRFIAQELAREVVRVCPQFERYFKFVDYQGYDLGRLNQEMRRSEKESARS